MEHYILALDQGTTSSRALIFNKKGGVVASAQKEFPQHFPKPGWVEHDPEDIWNSQWEVIQEALQESGIEPNQLAALGITNQRETVLVWDRVSGKPIYPAIVWQDKRTAPLCDSLKSQGKSELVRQKTGLVIDSYFSATKVHWILEQVPNARERAENGELLLGTIDSWLIWKLTQGQKHITDVTNASRTLLYNIHTLEWDAELLSLFKIPKSMLPKVVASSEIVGHTHSALLGTPIPIAGIAGDQQAALFGQMCTKKGMVKNTYGTGCFMLMNIGKKPQASENNLLTTIAWKRNGKVTYALEGSIFIAGAVVQWLRDGLQSIQNSAEVEALASSVSDTDGVFFVPAFTGLGAPHWDQHAQGTLFGMSRGTTKAHIARAALESIAYQTCDVLKAMEADSGISIKELRVDGGAAANDLLMQFQADVLQVPTVRPQNVETTAMGAAYLAGLAQGFWKSPDEIKDIWKTDVRFEPCSDQAAIDAGIQGWQRAIKALQYWSQHH